MEDGVEVRPLACAPRALQANEESAVPPRCRGKHRSPGWSPFRGLHAAASAQLPQIEHLWSPRKSAPVSVVGVGGVSDWTGRLGPYCGHSGALGSFGSPVFANCVQYFTIVPDSFSCVAVRPGNGTGVCDSTKR